MANKNVAGPIGKILTDALKEVCEHCNGVEFMFSMTFDDINDVAGELKALGITCTGGIISGLVVMCARCGHEQTRLAFILDKIKVVAAAAITMEHLDSSIINNLAGYFVIALGGTDAMKVFTVASNTVAAPTVITLTVAPNADTDEQYVLITQFTTEHTPAA